MDPIVDVEHIKRLGKRDFAQSLLESVALTERYTGYAEINGHPIVLYTDVKAADALGSYNNEWFEGAWLLYKDVWFCRELMVYGIVWKPCVSKTRLQEIRNRWKCIRRSCLSHMNTLRKAGKECRDSRGRVTAAVAVAYTLIYFWKEWFEGVEKCGYLNGERYDYFNYGATYMQPLDSIEFYDFSYVEKYVQKGLDRDLAKYGMSADD